MLDLLYEAAKGDYTKSYRDAIYSRVESTMNTRIDRELDKIAMGYMDKNSDILKSVNFSKRLLFPTSLKNKIMGMFGITEKMVRDAAKASSYIDPKWKVLTNPFYVTLASIIFYRVKNDNIKGAKLMSYFLGMPIFSSKVYSFFEHGVNQEIMDYTISKLPDNSLIKKTGTIFGMLVHTIDTAFETYEERMGDLDDETSYYVYISALVTRIGKNIRNIAEKYYENHKNGNYLNTDSDNLEEDDYRIVSSDTMRVAGLARKVVMNLATIGYDNKIIRLARNMSRDVSIKNLNGILDKIVEDKKNELNEFIVRCVEILYIKGHTIDEAKLPVFLGVAVEAYRSNTDDPTITFIKDKLEEWIDMNTSTKHNYKRSVFYTFILTIQKEAKGGDF